MEEPRLRAGVDHSVSRKSKRVSVSNLHLPPYPSEESLSRRDRWYLDHPYLPSIIVFMLVVCFGLVYRLYLGKSLTDALSGALPVGLGTMLSGLGFARYWRRLYRRPYRRDD
ncbi:MAG: hypothetical protein U0232_17250 [Thermomicrobiales bacterium]